MGETLYVKSLIKTLYVQSITGGTLSAEFVMEETIFTESSVEGTFYVKFTIKNKNTWQSLKLMKHILGNIFCWVAGTLYLESIIEEIHSAKFIME